MDVLKLEEGALAESRFFALPERVYADDPYFVPGGRRAETSALHEPSYARRQAVFLVEHAGETRGRGVARVTENPEVGAIGFFEALDDPDACRLLLAEAEQWLRARGAQRVLGPMEGDTWRRYRFMTGPRESPPFLREPWNPAYYPSLWERCGYVAVDRYYSSRIADPARGAEALAPYRRRVLRQGYSFDPINLRQLDRDLDRLYRLSLRIFEGNRHYTSIDRASFLRLYDGVRPLLVPSLCQFCRAPDGADVGFVFCYPDMAEAVRAMRGKSGLVAKLRFLRRRGRAARVCIKSLGCLPEIRGTGVGPALMGLAMEQTVACGYGEALMCLMHESNDSRRLDGGASEPFRQYVLYGKEL